MPPPPCPRRSPRTARLPRAGGPPRPAPGRPPCPPRSAARAPAVRPPPRRPRSRPRTPARRAHARGAPVRGPRPPPSARPACPPSRRTSGRRRRPSRAAARPGRIRRYGGAARGSRCAGGASSPSGARPAVPPGPRPTACPGRSRSPRGVTTDRRRHAVRRRCPRRHGAGAAGVVADHAAEGAAAVGGGVGAETQPVRGGGLLEPVEDETGLHDGRAGLGIEGEQAVHVPGEVEHHTGSGGLPRDRRAAAARHHGDAVRPADRQRRRHVVGVPGSHHAERHPSVVGGVHGRQRPRGGAEVHLAAHGRAQPFPQFPQFPQIRHVFRMPRRAAGRRRPGPSTGPAPRGTRRLPSRKTEPDSSQADHKLPYSERELRAVVGPRFKSDPGTGSDDPIESPERRTDDGTRADPTEDRPRT
ncbi:hypothetical protein SHIRM173S_08582 [Streptomyces hirsutus]